MRTVTMLLAGALCVLAVARSGFAQQVHGRCKVDADCGDPYLKCVATEAYVDDEPAVVDLCTPSYQVPCGVASDCGPDGFTCNLNGYQVCSDTGCETFSQCEGVERSCEKHEECPAGWWCFVPTRNNPCVTGCESSEDDAGTGMDTRTGADADTPKRCYPPFVTFFGGASWPDYTQHSRASTEKATEMTSDAQVPKNTGCGIASHAPAAGPCGASVLALLLVVALRRRRHSPSGM